MPVQASAYPCSTARRPFPRPVITGSRLCTRPAERGSLGRDDSWSLRRLLRPARERGGALGRETIDAALVTDEPAVDVAQQDLGRVGNGCGELARAARALGERGSAGERLLAV